MLASSSRSLRRIRAAYRCISADPGPLLDRGETTAGLREGVVGRMDDIAALFPSRGITAGRRRGLET